MDVLSMLMTVERLAYNAEMRTPLTPFEQVFAVIHMVTNPAHSPSANRTRAGAVDGSAAEESQGPSRAMSKVWPSIGGDLC